MLALTWEVLAQQERKLDDEFSVEVESLLENLEICMDLVVGVEVVDVHLVCFEEKLVLNRVKWVETYLVPCSFWHRCFRSP